MAGTWLVKLMREWLEKSGACRIWGRVEKQDRVRCRFTWGPALPVHHDCFHVDFIISLEALSDGPDVRDYIAHEMAGKYKEALERKRQEYYLCQWDDIDFSE